MTICTHTRILTPWDLQVDLFYDASNTDGRNNATSISSISSVVNLGTKANNVSQSTGASQPTLFQNANNNQPVMRFSGSQYLSAASAAPNQYAGEITVFGIVKLSNASVVRRFISFGATGGVSAGNRASPNLLKYDYTCNAVADVFTTADYWSTTDYETFVGVIKNSAGSWSVDFYKNGTFLQNVSTSAPIASSDSFCVGSYSTTVALWNGDIQLAGFFYSALKSWQINALSLFLQIRKG